MAASLILLTACTSVDGQTTPASDATLAYPVPTEIDPHEVHLSLVALGEVAEVAYRSGNVSLILKSATTSASCPSRIDGEDILPERGTFLILDLAVTMQGGTEPAPLGAEQFRIAVSLDDPLASATSEASWLCFEAADLLPAFVGDGESWAGFVVLDLDRPSGLVAYVPGAVAWEY